MTVPRWIIEIHDHLKTQRMCDEAVRNIPCTMLLVPDHLKTMEICNEIMRIMPEALHRIPDCFKTQEMCKKAAEADPSNLKTVLGHFKSQEMCDKAVRDDPFFSSMFPFGLLQGRGYICAMMTIVMVVIGLMMMINFLSGIMVIKNGRPRKHKLKKSYCLLPGIH